MRFILITLLVLITQYLYASQDKWENNSVESDIFPFITAEIFKNSLNKKNVGVITPSDYCTEFSTEVMKAPSFIINGTKVKVIAQCVAKNTRMDFPATDAGRNYVINEFKTKNKVSYTQDDFPITFSAKGFSKAFNEHGSEYEGL